MCKLTGEEGKEPNKTTARKASASFILFFFFFRGVHENALNYASNSLLALQFINTASAKKVFLLIVCFDNGNASFVFKAKMKKISLKTVEFF